MTAISGAFYSQFPATGVLGVSLTTIQGGASTSTNAASIISTTNSNPSSPFSVLGASHATTSSSPTINALTTGELSTADHKIIAAIGGTANDSLSIPWNANGTEPSTVSALRSLGWIKLTKPEVAAGSNVPTGGNYTLTPVGQAIYKRTVATTLGAGTQASLANAVASNPAASAALNSALSSQVSTLLSTLSSVGVNVQV